MLDAGCILAVSEYLLEPQLSRSFSLGREALTSTFHSEGTTGHVDHGLLQNTYSFILSPASSRFILSSRSFNHFCLSVPLSLPPSWLFSNVGTREMYTSGACDINVLACIYNLTRTWKRFFYYALCFPVCIYVRGRRILCTTENIDQ